MGGRLGGGGTRCRPLLATCQRHTVLCSWHVTGLGLDMSRTLTPGAGTAALVAGRWALDTDRWTLAAGRWTLIAGR